LQSVDLVARRVISESLQLSRFFIRYQSRDLNYELQSPVSNFLRQEKPAMNKNGMTDVGSTTRTVDERLDSIKHTVRDVVDQGAQRADALKSRMIDAKDQVLRRGNDALDRVVELIKANPIKAVGIAFVAGFIGMRLIRR